MSNLRNTLIFDLETDGLLNKVTKIHCMAYKFLGDDEVSLTTDYDEILAVLNLADVLVAHNAQGFDIPVIEKILKWRPYDEQEVHDTVIMSRVCHSDLHHEDEVAFPWWPKKRKGSHSLAAWGHRLGEYKDDYNGGWETYSDEMGSYCIQDVVVLSELYDRFLGDIYDDHGQQRLWVTLEHEFAQAIDSIMKRGVRIDTDAAVSLAAELTQEVEDMRGKMIAAIPGRSEEMKTPEYYTHRETGERYRIKADCPPKERKNLLKGPMKVKTIPFNPTSRPQVAKFLREQGWKPKEFTDAGHDKVSYEILEELDLPFSKDFAKLFRLVKLQGLVQGGDHALLRVEKGGRIYGRIGHNHTISGRCNHSSPNLGNPDKDPRVRALFIPRPGGVMMGWDASGLELRKFAHYLRDDAYTEQVESGDIHTYNQSLAGLVTRDQAKTFIYALIYGGGPEKLGAIVDNRLTPAAKKARGLKLRARFMERLPRYRQMVNSIKLVLKTRGFMRGLDGRPLRPRSAHSAVNLLLQSAGAVVMKMVTVNMWRHIRDRDDIHMVLHVHDEMQFDCASVEVAEAMGEHLNQLIQEVGHELDLRCKLAGEYRTGQNWSETH